ncbi:RagB/SusD family nutrient uptake outer membrane protein [Fodinibius saliphilus]|uniref:RagB/SusD family nutrient uptake outer membrane protein n=1 Tax=Fodinibius saliphilus TaxID=1920650 RepID=UPI001486793C|nr:RagB/SusD family nutrient uptake outer membrane protein [Fodinibius saliphilus]
MFKPNKILAIVLIALMTVAITSCVDDLNTSPLDDDVVTSESVYESPSDYKKVLAKLYAGFATTGQQGPAGNADIQGIDEGFSSYVRQLWVHQEIPTDEAVVAWQDPGLPSFNFQEWTASNDFVMGLYSRIYYEISLANEFIRNAKGNENTEVQGYMAEARFIRALSYWHALDFYGGGVPFVTEEDGVGAYLPEPSSAEELFNFIESELKAIESELPAPKQNEYARADQAAVWTLLTKLYLNAEVYTGEAHYNEAVTYADKIINDGSYTLENNYGDLFKADNHTANGIIFPIAFDGVNIKTYGGTTFITHAAVGGNMNPAEFGIDGGWSGHRVTPEFANKLEKTGLKTNNPDNDNEIFVPGGYQSSSGYGSDWTPEDSSPLVSDSNNDIYTGLVYFKSAGNEFKFASDNSWSQNWGDNEGDGTLEANGGNITNTSSGLHHITVNLNDMTYQVEHIDNRNTLFTDGQDKEITNVKTDISDFSKGYTITKWKNITSTGQAGSDEEFVDIDYPMFRLADVYLMYAEATLRGGSGSVSKALNLVNDIRERAFENSSMNISSSELTLDFILDERARELYWEGHRRTDLVRYDLFTTGDYVWAGKGKDANGTATNDNFRLFPIPASDVNSNTNLTQNPGY